MSLTVKQVAKLRRAGKPGRFLDSGASGVRGLYLIVQSRTAAHWELRYELHGRTRWMGLGSAGEFDLEQARARAKAMRQQLADKIDPLDARRVEQAAKAAATALAVEKTRTFKWCAEEFIRTNEDKWENRRHASQWQSTLRTFVFPVIGHLPVAAVDTGLVLKVLEQPVAAAGGIPAGSLWQTRRETARRIRGRIETILGWATVRGYRSGDNPARWKNHLELALSGKSAVEVEHHSALPWRDLPAFMPTLRQREGQGARALEFLILTAARTDEVTGATWDEIDLEQRVWTIPARRMKKRREHRVPLSDRAVELLQTAYREDGNNFVFVGARRGAGLAPDLTVVLRRMGQREITAHGFRSSFRDWASESTNFPPHVVEMALAHLIKDKVEAAYRRGDLFEKRRKLMDAWATFCASTPVERSADIVPLRRA